MEHTLKKITNQARFIMMIVEGQLKISKRKRIDVVKDLKSHKFEIWSASKDSSNTLRNRAKATDAFEDEEENENESKNNNDSAMDIDAGDIGNANDLQKYSNGYKYLLSMSLSSLTKERVQELLKKQDDTLKEVNALKQKTVKDLWRNDLEELDVYLEEYDKSYQQNVELQRIEAEKKRKSMKSKITAKKKKTTRGKTKRTTKTKGKTVKKESTSSSSKESSLRTGMEKLFKKTKVTKNTSSKKKKKLLSSSNALPSDPFSIAKSATKKKSKFVDSDDEDSESPDGGLSLFERARLIRNSPQKSSTNSRKRKRQSVDSENDSDSDSGLEELEPPRKKNKSSSLSTSGSSVTLKSISMNKEKSKSNKKKSKSLMSESDDNYSDESEEYKPPTKQRAAKYKNDTDEDFDIDADEEEEDANHNEKRRVLRRNKTKKSYKEKSEP